MNCEKALGHMRLIVELGPFELAFTGTANGTHSPTVILCASAAG